MVCFFKNGQSFGYHHSNHKGTAMKEGWELKSLGEIADVEYGFTDKSEEEGDYRYVRITDIDNSGELISTEKRYLKYSKEAEGFLIQDNDLLMARTGATFAKVLLYKDFEPSVFASYLIRIKFKEKIENKLYWYFTKTKSYWEQANSLASGAAQPHFNGAAVKQVIFSYPKSLPEQQRIVAILDEAFTAIAKAKAIAEQNLKNAKELFESYLQGVFENKGEGWEEKKLIEITTKIGSGATPRGGNESYKTEGISLIRSMNVHDFEFRERNLAFIDDQQAKELNNVTLQENDVLLNITGASVARCCVIPKEYLPARVNQHVSIIRAKKELIDPIFLNLLLTSKFYKDQLLFTGEQGATRQAITKAQLEVFKIAFPKSIKEQKSLMNKLDALSTETKRLEVLYQQKINDLEELKKSVLQKAFNGEL
jgi:type I restriction enzyme S subunit